MKSKSRVRLLLAMQVAQLGRVGCNVRGISCAFEGNNIKIKSIFDGVISDDDREDAEEMATEVASHFYDAMVDVQCVQMDFPASIREEMLVWWIFFRKEPSE